MNSNLYIGTSGWHYSDWLGLFYPTEVKGYNELKFHAQHFNTVENNSSFYRIAQESTYKTWYRMTPEYYKFSLKLNKLITHIYKLELNDEVKDKIHYILTSTQVLKEKMGVIIIQLPASFKYNIEVLEKFINFFKEEINKHIYKFNVAIEFRNKYWFIDNTYSLLEKHNIALIAGQSSRYIGVRQITANFAYIRMHGPEKLFASKYSTDQLKDLSNYIQNILPKLKEVYVYFNNDFHGFAIENAIKLKSMMN